MASVTPPQLHRSLHREKSCREKKRMNGRAMFQWNFTQGLWHLNFTYCPTNQELNISFLEFSCQPLNNIKSILRGFPCGSVVENSLASAGDTGSLIQEDAARRRATTCVPHLSSLRSRPRELRLLNPACPRARAPRQEMPPYCVARITSTRVAFTWHN